jgi:MSHA pilin protein MshC
MVNDATQSVGARIAFMARLKQRIGDQKLICCCSGQRVRNYPFTCRRNSRGEVVSIPFIRYSLTAIMDRPTTPGKSHYSPVCQRGFTLVELITVMIIVGIMAAIVAPRFFNTNTFQSRGFADQVQATLRYAQKEAIAQRRFVCVSFLANNSITLTYGTDNTCASGTLASPSGTAYPLTSNNAIFSPVPAAGFSFDCLGRPRTINAPVGACGDANGVLVANQTVQVQNATLITIERETGYVHSP